MLPGIKEQAIAEDLIKAARLIANQVPRVG